MLTRGEGHDRVDFEDGVWVHRTVVRDHPPASVEGGATIPAPIWSYAATMRDEVARIAARRTVHGVYAPVWDCEGAAVLRDGRHPVLIGLQTMLRFWMQSNTARLADARFVAEFVAPMLTLEAEMLRQAPGAHAISAAILADVEAMYGIKLAARAAVVPLGLADYRRLPATAALG